MKRPSDTNSSPPEPVFFADRNLGRYIFPEQVRSQGVRLEVHDDHFPPDEQDAGWIKEVGKRGWTVLTADQRIRRVSLETEALMAAGVRAFIFVGKTDVRVFAKAFLRARRRIERLLGKEEGPFIAKIYRNGTVKLSLTHKEWKANRTSPL